MSSWTVEFYAFANGEVPALDWLLQQNPKVQANYSTKFGLLQEFGLKLHEPHVKTLGPKIFELRIRCEKICYRMLFSPVPSRRFIMLHAFVKKSQKTPRSDIQIAEKRLADFKESEKSYAKESVH